MPEISHHTGKKEIIAITEELRQKPEALASLMATINSSDQRISMRASWAMLHFSFEEPELTEPYIPELLKFLNKDQLHTGSIRNCIRIFTVVNIGDEYVASVFDKCMAYLSNPQMPHAVRAFSIQTMLILCKRYPELGYELRTVIRHTELEDLPPSLRVWIRRAHQWFNKTLTPP